MHKFCQCVRRTNAVEPIFVWIIFFQLLRRDHATLKGHRGKLYEINYYATQCALYTVSVWYRTIQKLQHQQNFLCSTFLCQKHLLLSTRNDAGALNLFFCSLETNSSFFFSGDSCMYFGLYDAKNGCYNMNFNHNSNFSKSKQK